MSNDSFTQANERKDVLTVFLLLADISFFLLVPKNEIFSEMPDELKKNKNIDKTNFWEKYWSPVKKIFCDEFNEEKIKDELRAMDDVDNDCEFAKIIYSLKKYIKDNQYQPDVDSKEMKLYFKQRYNHELG